MRRAFVVLIVVVGLLAAASAAFSFGRAGGVGALFGSRMIRAEVVERDGSVYDLYRGRLVVVTRAAVTVREADGHLDTVPVVASTRITLNGAPVRLAALRRGMHATVVRPSNAAATIVQARGR